MQDRIKDDGGPAYPMVEKIYIKGKFAEKESDGLTKRDVFAIAAMQGIVANPCTAIKCTYEDIADEAYKYADFMLEARKK